MKKIRLIFNFILQAVFWGILSCAVLEVVGALLNRNTLMSGIVSGTMAGVVAGVFQGIILGVVTALYFYPLAEPGHYHDRMIYFASIFTLVVVPLSMFSIVYFTRSNPIFLWLYARMLLFILTAPFIAYYVSAWYLKSQPTFD